ncbi:protein amnionless [Pangasianodon hypophthalmus]|uniref:protein amnionless n=1 Tax=Pangasianodon hypophthalmus TaxID=310915 RepID=UPI00147ABA55|nr:protein amnionless [Pangasianodon hypophthalmus]
MMATRQDLFILLSMLGSACALYKQWVPDTNFENVTNWDKGSLPCGSDQVVFSASGKVAVYVGEAHTLSGMRLPVDGEFILASGAGFSVREGQDPSCGTGGTAHFRDPDSLKWFDPALWKSASSLDHLQNGPYLFFVHEETVPCQHDDVVFRDGSSFRVDVSAHENSVPVKSVMVLGRKFTDNSYFSEYTSSDLGKLQFHGSSAVRVSGSACDDITGCECGNSGNHDRICSNVKCPELDCKKPLYPVGHCCDVCGAIMTIHFSDSFNIESYRQRLQHLFLSLSKYKSIQMALSKVSKTQRLMRVIPYGITQEIQVVLLDENTGPQSGKLAEALAKDILSDIDAQGSHLGIDSAEFHASSGASSGDVSGMSGGEVAGIILGILALVAFLALFVVLHRRGMLRVPNLPSLSSWRKDSEIGDLGGPLDHGFANPMFEKQSTLPEISGLYGTESLNGITLTHSGVHFVNPVYDETDFNA